MQEEEREEMYWHSVSNNIRYLRKAYVMNWRKIYKKNYWQDLLSFISMEDADDSSVTLKRFYDIGYDEVKWVTLFQVHDERIHGSLVSHCNKTV